MLTKSCHDIDFLLWILCSSQKNGSQLTHLPSSLSSSGSLNLFKKSRKPKAAGAATNCLSCPIEQVCAFSAKKLYYEGSLLKGNTGWPVDVVDAEIGEIRKERGLEIAGARLLKCLQEDYDCKTPSSVVETRSWFGRCVWEADNNVCDDQIVTITWDDEVLPSRDGDETTIYAKRAIFHMVAFTESICERRGRVYGTAGEVSYDSKGIRVYRFANGQHETQFYPNLGQEDHHGGGDQGLTEKFMVAVDAVKNKRMTLKKAEDVYLGCSLAEIIRSHAMVFAAEEARREQKTVDWKAWWSEVSSR